MQHNKAGRKLGRTTSHRFAVFRNQLASLLAHERIVTTVHKAKELRPIAEKIITQGKRGTQHARRLAGRWIADRELLKKLFEQIAPRFSTRPGGYLRIVKLGSRLGDGAEMAILEFVDFQPAKKAAPAPSAEKGGKEKGKAASGEIAAEAAEGGEAKEKPAKKPAKKAAEKAGRPPQAQKRPAEKKAAKAAPASRAKPAKSAAPKKTSGPKKTGGA